MAVVPQHRLSNELSKNLQLSKECSVFRVVNSDCVYAYAEIFFFAAIVPHLEIEYTVLWQFVHRVHVLFYRVFKCHASFVGPCNVDQLFPFHLANLIGGTNQLCGRRTEGQILSAGSPPRRASCRHCQLPLSFSNDDRIIGQSLCRKWPSLCPEICLVLTQCKVCLLSSYCKPNRPRLKYAKRLFTMRIRSWQDMSSCTITGMRRTLDENRLLKAVRREAQQAKDDSYEGSDNVWAAKNTCGIAKPADAIEFPKGGKDATVPALSLPWLFYLKIQDGVCPAFLLEEEEDANRGSDFLYTSASCFTRSRIGSTGYIYQQSGGKENTYAVGVSTSGTIPKGLVMLEMNSSIFEGLCLKKPTITFPIDQCVSMLFMGNGGSLTANVRKAKLLPDHKCEKKFHSNSTASEFCVRVKDPPKKDRFCCAVRMSHAGALLAFKQQKPIMRLFAFMSHFHMFIILSAHNRLRKMHVPPIIKEEIIVCFSGRHAFRAA
ncbi:hypothetical protein D918_07813 [Trichuris suis]|nr:hypothetical protein D918_07813 [Trichuris suis]